MTKEQEEAIEYVKYQIETGSLINGYTDIYYFKEDLEIVLNLIQEQQKEIEIKQNRIQELEKALIDDDYKYKEEMKRKDKIIDLMAVFFNKRSWKEHQIKDEICLCCTTEFGDEDCKDCIKQYFENQAKM